MESHETYFFDFLPVSAHYDGVSPETGAVMVFYMDYDGKWPSCSMRIFI